MSLSVAGRENIKTVGSKNASKTFVGDHWEKYWGFVGMGWDSRCALGIGPEIGRWDWDYENRHWADTDPNSTVVYLLPTTEDDDRYCTSTVC